MKIVKPDPRVREARMANGLVRGHAYTITKVAYANVRGQDVMLVRIRYLELSWFRYLKYLIELIVNF